MRKDYFEFAAEIVNLLRNTKKFNEEEIYFILGRISFETNNLNSIQFLSQQLKERNVNKHQTRDLISYLE